MIDSFKNFERLRYRLSNDMRELASDNKENSDSLKGQMSNTVFATIFSAFITEVALKDNGNGYDFCMIMKMITVFVIIYITSYILYGFLYNKIMKIWKARKIYSINSGMDKMIQIQKDFDNIACDSILVARGYRNAYDELENIPSNKTLKIFYYYEIMHYLDVSCEKTEDLIKHKENCIRTMDEAIGVDIFRVVNIKSMMEELDGFLEGEFNNLCVDEHQKVAIQYQREQLKTKIGHIRESV